MSQLCQGLGLDLANTFPGDAEVVAHLFEGANLAVGEAEAHDEDFTLAIVQSLEGEAGVALQQVEGGGFNRNLSFGVFNEIAERRIVFFAEWRLAGLQGG